MAIVRNPSNTIRRGRIGETTYYVSGGQQVARQARNSSNYGVEARRSQSQQSRRVMWANLVNFYKVSADWMSKAFETRKQNQTDYNKFMQLNIGKARVSLTKEEAAASAAVADTFLVSQGSLPSIEIQELGPRWVTSLSVGSATLEASNTIADWSKALVENNAILSEGMQLSFVSYQQSIDALQTPRLVCRCYEVILNTKDTRPMSDFIPSFGASVTNGKLSTGTNVSIGGFAYILSDLRGGKLLVSTQQLVANNVGLLTTYTSAEQKKKAIASYGVDKEVILSPVTANAQEAEAQPVFIIRLYANEANYYPNGTAPAGGDVSSKFATIYFSTEQPNGAATIRVLTTSGKTYTVQGAVDEGSLGFTMPAMAIADGAVKSVTATLASKQILTITFDTSDSGYGGDL